MKTILMTISRGSLVRNFFHTGVINKLLVSGFRLIVLTQNYQDKELFKDYQHPNLIFEPLYESKRKYFPRLMPELLKGAVFNQTVHFIYRYKISGRLPKKIYYLPRLLFFAPLRWLPGFKRFIQWVDAKLNPQREHDWLFKKYKIDLVFVTSIGGDPDLAVLKSARRFRLPTVGMAKSWDNLSKNLFGAKADYLIVWGEFGRKQAIKWQGYKPSEVIVTGAPQFDFYTRTELRESREEFCRRFNFDPAKPIVLYGVGGGVDIYDETQYIDLLHSFMAAGELPQAQVLIRPHLGYLGIRERFLACERHAGFVVDRTDQQSDKFGDHWDTSFNHIKNLCNSLRHAAVCINIVSTLSLDSLACGTPVINIKFDVKSEQPELAAARMYKLDYVQALTSRGAIWVAASPADFLEALKDILLRGKSRRPAEEELLRYFLHKIDGRSAERIAGALAAITNKVFEKASS